MATIVRDDTLPDVVIPSCKVRQVLKGQKALVTSANWEIGKAVACALGEAGADVVVNYVRGDEAAVEVVDRMRVNSVSPGAIRTPINTSTWSTADPLERLLTFIPHNRTGEPEDIGGAIAWMASDESDYVNGVRLYVDGGMTLCPGFATGG
jgi:NAD(P)-dependent dehydrogenase (short-subunit alcohol dehydrogenase family)